MRAVVQRVSSARVTVDDGSDVVGEIGEGLCVLVGVTHGDGPDEAAKLAAKMWNLRIFDDAEGVDEPVRGRRRPGAARGQPVHAVRRYPPGSSAVVDRRRTPSRGRAPSSRPSSTS